MSAESRQSKKREVILAGLDITIQVLSIAKDICSVPPAQIALGSACALLTIIKAGSLLFFNGELFIHVYSGHHGHQTRLSRSRPVLR